MTTRTVNRLLGLEIDEVSLVDRPANQHGLVAITKRDSGESMGTGLYDAEGVEFQDDELEAGMTCFDEDGERRVLLDEELAQALLAEGVDLEDTEEIEAILADLEVPDDASELEDERQLASVGKSGGRAAITGGVSTLRQTGRRLPDKALGQAGNGRGPSLGRRASLRSRGVGKSMGNALLADLSKAYTDGERDRVVTKAFDDLSAVAKAAQSRAERAERIAKGVIEREELATYTEIAKSYELPVDPNDLGPILQTIAKSGLNQEQLDLVDRVFQAAGEAIFVEKGFSGRNESGVMELISGEALELVGKAAGDVSPEQAAVAIMGANPQAYEDYLYETRG